jgi:hypothetical protein
MAEAGFSMNVKMLDEHGQEVQLTFRCALASQAEKLIGHYKNTVDRLMGAGWQVSKAGVKATQASAGDAAPTGAAPSCRIHGGQMKPSRKPGSFFCSRKLADGSYCQEKVEG